MFHSNINPGLINPWSSTRGVSPFSGDSITSGGSTPLIMGRVYYLFPAKPDNGTASASNSSLRTSPMSQSEGSPRGPNPGQLIFNHQQSEESFQGLFETSTTSHRARSSLAPGPSPEERSPYPCLAPPGPVKTQRGSDAVLDPP